jgi:hypothetical protein
MEGTTLMANEPTTTITGNLTADPALSATCTFCSKRYDPNVNTSADPGNFCSWQCKYVFDNGFTWETFTRVLEVLYCGCGKHKRAHWTRFTLTDATAQASCGRCGQTVSTPTAA